MVGGGLAYLFDRQVLDTRTLSITGVSAAWTQNAGGILDTDQWMLSLGAR